MRSDARQVGAAEAREVETALRDDPDAKAVREIAATLAETASKRGITKAEYTAAAKSGGIDVAAAKLGMPAAEFSELALEFQAHMEALLERYPVLAEIQSGNAELAPPTAEGVAFALAEEGGCKWLQYIACLALCTQTGPLYIVCALLCWCSYCTDSQGNPWGVCEL